MAQKSVILHALMSLMLTGDHETPPTTAPTATPTPPPTPPTTIPPIPPISTEEGCYHGYGCFPIDGIWGGAARPVPLYPLPPADLTPTFCLHTPARPSCYILDEENLSTLNDSFLRTSMPSSSSSSSVILLTHGYLESTQLEWVEGLVWALLSKGDGRHMGVITVDWSRAAPPTYAQAVANIRLVGVMTGRLLERLLDHGVPTPGMHLVGHSLGAHLMAYASNHLMATRGVQVGRLTGLDPAGPYFSGTDIEVRLDPSDADFVDVIHTDSPSQEWELNRLGFAEALGHVDFYPNGGHQQAGCQGSAAAHIQRTENVAGGVLSYLGCSHQRSHQFFAESLQNNKCLFVGVECSSWEVYKAGGCWGCAGGRCQVMGYPARRPEDAGEEGEVMDAATGEMRQPPGSLKASPASTKKIFLGTNPEPAFCAEQYRVTLITSSSLSAREGEGSEGDVARFTVTLRGHLRTVTIPAPSRDAWVEAGGTTQWVGWGTGELGGVYNLRVEYEVEQDLIQALLWMFEPPKMYVKEFVVEALSTGAVIRFPFCGGKMQGGESYTLLPDANCP